MGKLREAAWARSGGRCEASGRPLPTRWDLHHRRPKGMGGTSRPDTDTLPNVLALHPDVHNLKPDSVHMLRSWSEPRGYLLPQSEDHPELVPVLVHGATWAVLAGDTYAPVPQGIEWEVVWQEAGVLSLTHTLTLRTEDGARRMAEVLGEKPHVTAMVKPARLVD
jgi:hypothetical protein